jgi:hypothetical protein
MTNLQLHTRLNGFETFFEIERRINNTIPSSIWFGDGEGTMLGYPDITDRQAVDRSLFIWFDRKNFSDAEISSIST